MDNGGLRHPASMRASAFLVLALVLTAAVPPAHAGVASACGGVAPATTRCNDPVGGPLGAASQLIIEVSPGFHGTIYARAVQGPDVIVWLECTWVAAGVVPPTCQGGSSGGKLNFYAFVSGQVSSDAAGAWTVRLTN